MDGGRVDVTMHGGASLHLCEPFRSLYTTTAGETEGKYVKYVSQLEMYSFISWIF